MSIFSNELSKLMKDRDMSDEELGKRVGVNRTTVSRWRSGERSPKMEKLPEIAAVFNVDPRTFVGEVKTSSIEEIYNQLIPERQKKIFNYAKNELEEQNKNDRVISMDNKNDSEEIHTLAAHAADPSKEYSQEEIDNIKSVLDEARKKFENKNRK